MMRNLLADDWDIFRIVRAAQPGHRPADVAVEVGPGHHRQAAELPVRGVQETGVIS
jgi:hypothetical protein